jgi:hypothetical protein
LLDSRRGEHNAAPAAETAPRYQGTGWYRGELANLTAAEQQQVAIKLFVFIMPLPIFAA